MSAKEIDILLKQELAKQKIPYTDIFVGSINISKVCDFILDKAKEI